MIRTRRLAIVAVLAAMGWAATATARIEPPRKPFPALDAAMGRFLGLAADKLRHGDLPRVSDPEAAPVLQAIWGAAGSGPDPKGYGPEPRKPSKDDVIIAAMVKSTVELYELLVLDTYLHFPEPLPSPPGIDAARPLPAGFDADRLAKQFGPEVARCLAASIFQVAEMSAVMEQGSLVDLGESARMMKDMSPAQAPSRRLVHLAQVFMRAPSFGTDNAVLVATAFADHATDFALIFSPADRARIASSLAATAVTDGRVRQNLDRFAETLQRAPCGRLCSLP